MIKHCRSVIAGIFLLPTLAVANFTLSPVKLTIHKDEKITAFTITNNTNTVTEFQLTTFKIEKVKDEEVDELTKDIIVTPLSFKLAPGLTQIIRVAIKDNIRYQLAEKAYRISVKELPHRINNKGANIELVTEFKLPVSITDIKPKGELE